MTVNEAFAALDMSVRLLTNQSLYAARRWDQDDLGRIAGVSFEEWQIKQYDAIVRHIENLRFIVTHSEHQGNDEVERLRDFLNMQSRIIEKLHQQVVAAILEPKADRELQDELQRAEVEYLQALDRWVEYAEAVNRTKAG